MREPDPAPLEEGTAFIQFSGGTTETQKSVPVSHALLHRALTSYAASLDLREDDHFISGFPDGHRLFSDIIVYLVPTPQGPDFIVGANVSPASAARLDATS